MLNSSIDVCFQGIVQLYCPQRSQFSERVSSGPELHSLFLEEQFHFCLLNKAKWPDFLRFSDQNFLRISHYPCMIFRHLIWSGLFYSLDLVPIFFSNFIPAWWTLGSQTNFLTLVTVKCKWYVWGRKGVHTGLWWGQPNRNRQLGRPRSKWKVIIIWLLNK